MKNLKHMDNYNKDSENSLPFQYHLIKIIMFVKTIYNHMKIISILFLLTLPYIGACQSQDKGKNPNFGFETKDSTGVFPAQWFRWTRDVNYDFALDKKNKFKGKYALSISNEEKTTTQNGIIGWRSFLSYPGKKITLTTWAKTENVDKGKVGLIISTTDKYGKDRTTWNFNPQSEETKNWQEYKAEINCPEDMAEIRIGLVLGGTGRVWFDNVEVLIDNKNIRTLAPDCFVSTMVNLDTIVPDSIISWQRPLLISKKGERTVVEKNSLRLLYYTPVDSTKAHPSAAVFPGAVSASSPRVSRKIQLQHTPVPENLKHIVANLYYSGKDSHTMYSTGLYAAPGEIITVEIPDTLKGKIDVQIGCHTDNLTQWMAADEDWRRMPYLVKKTSLKENTTRSANPFGGLVYITCSPGAEACSGEITIRNAVAAPHFIMGKTTDEEWKKMVQETGAPWGELESNGIILTLSTENLKKITNPTKQAETWDMIVNACYDLAQIPTPYFRKQRIVTDVHIGGGAMHSGYPIMATHCPSLGMDSEFSIADPGKLLLPSKGGANWGFFHEIGHNMQNVKDWVFNGTTEVSVNFFSLYIFDHVLGGRNDAHEGISIESTHHMMKDYFAKGAKFSDWAESPFLGLITFRQIQSDFGWEPFKTVFRRFHEENAKGHNKQYSDQEKIDNFVTYFSQATNRNFVPFFKTWGIPVSENVSTTVSGYPVWMPYNFPPKTSE